MAILREGKEEKIKRRACDARETEKFLKNYLSFNPIFAKHTIFATQMTCEWVAKIPWTQILQIFSKSFSRLDFHSLVSCECL